MKKILSTTSNIKKLICPFFSLFLLLKISPNFLAKNPTFKENAVYENLTVYLVFHKLFAIFPFCVIFFFFDEYYHFYHLINLCYFTNKIFFLTFFNIFKTYCVLCELMLFLTLELLSSGDVGDVLKWKHMGNDFLSKILK